MNFYYQIWTKFSPSKNMLTSALGFVFYSCGRRFRTMELLNRQKMARTSMLEIHICQCEKHSYGIENESTHPP